MKEPTRGIEVESKFELTEDDFDQLRNSGRVIRCNEQLNVYYDAGGRLASAAITLRVRLTKGIAPRMTLKIPEGLSQEKRRSVEIEADFRSRIPMRLLAVPSDLPQEFASPLSELGINAVERLGWMRTTRWLVAFGDEVEVELDRVDLPGGTVFYEAEVEEAESGKHSRAVAEVRKRASNASPSCVSKFERFARVLRSRSQNGGSTPPSSPPDSSARE